MKASLTSIVISLSFVICLSAATARESDIKVLMAEARQALARDEFNTARKQLEKVIRIQGELPEAYYLLGEVFAKKDQTKRAIKQLKKALGYQPDYPEASYLLAHSHLRRHERKKARRVLRIGTVSMKT